MLKDVKKRNPTFSDRVCPSVLAVQPVGLAWYPIHSATNRSVRTKIIIIIIQYKHYTEKVLINFTLV